MKKSDAIKQRDEAVSKSQTLSNEISDIKIAKTNLENCDVDLKYLLENAEHIESTHHLAGKKYESNAQNEEKVVNDLKEFLNTKKAGVLQSLNLKLSTLLFSKGVVDSQIQMLNVLIPTLKD